MDKDHDSFYSFLKHYQADLKKCWWSWNLKKSDQNDLEEESEIRILHLTGQQLPFSLEAKCSTKHSYNKYRDNFSSHEKKGKRSKLSYHHNSRIHINRLQDRYENEYNSAFQESVSAESQFLFPVSRKCFWNSGVFRRKW